MGCGATHMSTCHELVLSIRRASRCLQFEDFTAALSIRQFGISLALFVSRLEDFGSSAPAGMRQLSPIEPDSAENVGHHIAIDRLGRMTRPPADHITAEPLIA